MTTFDPERFGKRLRAEMERRALDVKTLQGQVQRRAQQQSGKGRGTSYGTIWSYVNGKAPVEPRREVVEALAHVLGVLPEYLTHGGPRTQLEAEAMGGGLPDEPEDSRGQRVSLLIRAMRSAEARLDMLSHDAFLGRTQMLEGLTVAFLESGGGALLDHTPEQVEQAMLTVAWLLYFPAEALGATDMWNDGTGGRDAYFYAMASALRIAISGHDSGFPLNAIDSARVMRETWEDRLPYKSSPEAAEELTRDRGRTLAKENDDA